MYPLIAGLRRLEHDMDVEDRNPAYRHLDHPINLSMAVMRSGDWPSTVTSWTRLARN
jgi:hypothetical protein